MTPDSQEMQNVLLFKERLKIQNQFEKAVDYLHRCSETPSPFLASEVWAKDKSGVTGHIPYMKELNTLSSSQYSMLL